VTHPFFCRALGLNSTEDAGLVLGRNQTDGILSYVSFASPRDKMSLVKSKVRNRPDDSCRILSHYYMILLEDCKSRISVLRPLNVQGVMERWNPLVSKSFGVEPSECPGNNGALKSQGLSLSSAPRQFENFITFLST
jgi:hypothetical protein